MKKLRIIFMGTPEFAVASLKMLVEREYKVIAVVTSPDKPAGRGQKIKESDVKQYAKTLDIPILQPTNLKDENFIQELRSLQPDLQVVVAFRMLPEVVFSIPAFGSFNLHASLLPEYRGAAPINWAIINGETKTGVTTFFLDKKMDTGNIILQVSASISETDTAGTLHDRLMELGANLVIQTVEKIESKTYQLIDQKDLVEGDKELKKAPKIFKEDCKINWKDHLDTVYNKIRGLSPYPAAFTELQKENKKYALKIFNATKKYGTHHYHPGQILSDGKSYLHIAVEDGFIKINELQMAGKKRMSVENFLRGFQDIEKCTL